MARWAIPPNLHTETIGGPVCYFHDHNIGSRDGRIPRYSDSHACVRCISSLMEGRLTLDVHRMEARHRRRFLEFWSFVEIRDPEECWPWRGRFHSRSSSGYFSIPRHWGRGRSFSAQRVATWFSWGDVGVLPIKHTCGDNNCCNPLHVRVQGVPHFYHNRKLLLLDLEFNSRKLSRETDSFLVTTRDRDPKRFEEFERHNRAWIEYRIASQQPVQPGEIDFGEMDDDDDDVLD